MSKVVLLTFFDVIVFGLGLIGYLDIFHLFKLNTFVHNISGVLVFVPIFHVMVETLALLLGRLFHIFSYKYLMGESNYYETMSVSEEDLSLNVEKPEFEIDPLYPFDLN